MNIRDYFKTSETEVRLIDYVSFFYLIQVIMFTVDDIKKNYPIYLVTLGILFHSIAMLTWLDQGKPKSGFGTTKLFIHKILPIGLTVTYLISILTGIQIGEITRQNFYNVILFMVTAIPMIMFYISIGYNVQTFEFLKQRRTGTNYIFLILIVTMLVGQRIIYS